MKWIVVLLFLASCQSADKKRVENVDRYGNRTDVKTKDGYYTYVFYLRDRREARDPAQALEVFSEPDGADSADGPQFQSKNLTLNSEVFVPEDSSFTADPEMQNVPCQIAIEKRLGIGAGGPRFGFSVTGNYGIAKYYGNQGEFGWGFYSHDYPWGPLKNLRKEIEKSSAWETQHGVWSYDPSTFEFISVHEATGKREGLFEKYKVLVDPELQKITSIEVEIRRGDRQQSFEEMAMQARFSCSSSLTSL